MSGEDARKIFAVETVSRRVFATFNYEEVKLPTIEEAALFLRTIGESSDIVEKQMYVFKDKGERTVALRPEGTAGAVRSYIQHNMAATGGITKLFYCGSMFRYERPQEGRYREFYQIGCEYFGNHDAVCDAEIIVVARKILSDCGVKNPKILINSIGCKECRPRYAKSVGEYASSIKENLCDDCRRRIGRNPLRILDCKTDSANLSGFPLSENYICSGCKERFERVKQILAAQNIAFTVEPKLARGLDYYTGTVFEITSEKLGAQDTVAAGGRYDNLVEDLGGKPTPACGFALGVERVVLASDGLPQVCAKKIFVAVAENTFTDIALNLAMELREKNLTVEGPLPGRSLKSQMNIANKLGFGTVIIFADEEFKNKEAIIKDMSTGSQTTVKIEKIKDII